METDPKAGMFAADYTGITEENREKARKVVEIIEDLIENEEKIYEILENEDEEIMWW